MRIVFFGTPELAVPSLDAVHARFGVAAVVCRADRPRGRSKKLVSPPAKAWALEHGVEVAQPEKLNDGTFEAWLRDRAPEVCAVAAYGRILKQPLLDVPPRGYLNVHPSLLPRYRGASPIQTAILEGDRETGVTIMAVDAGMDTGDILLQETAPILDTDTSASLSERLAQLGARLLVEGLTRVAAGEAHFRPQDESAVTHCHLFEKNDGRIRWGSPARDIHNLVRAAFPWPVAHCAFDGATFRIHTTEVIDAPDDGPPGTVVRVEKDAIAVATGQGLLSIRRLQAPGKRAMDAVDFLRGHAVAPGATFEDL